MIYLFVKMLKIASSEFLLPIGDISVLRPSLHKGKSQDKLYSKTHFCHIRYWHFLDCNLVWIVSVYAKHIPSPWGMLVILMLWMTHHTFQLCATKMQCFCFLIVKNWCDQRITIILFFPYHLKTQEDWQNFALLSSCLWK